MKILIFFTPFLLAITLTKHAFAFQIPYQEYHLGVGRENTTFTINDSGGKLGELSKLITGSVSIPSYVVASSGYFYLNKIAKHVSFYLGAEGGLISYQFSSAGSDGNVTASNPGAETPSGYLLAQQIYFLGPRLLMQYHKRSYRVIPTVSAMYSVIYGIGPDFRIGIKYPTKSGWNLTLEYDFGKNKTTLASTQAVVEATRHGLVLGLSYIVKDVKSSKLKKKRARKKSSQRRSGPAIKQKTPSQAIQKKRSRDQPRQKNKPPKNQQKPRAKK